MVWGAQGGGVSLGLKLGHLHLPLSPAPPGTPPELDRCLHPESRLRPQFTTVTLVFHLRQQIYVSDPAFTLVILGLC